VSAAPSTGSDEREEVVVEGAQLPERRNPPRSTEPLDRKVHREHQRIPPPAVEQECLDLALEAIQLRAWSQAQPCAQDDAQRDSPHRWKNGEWDADGPGAHGLKRLQPHCVEAHARPFSLERRDHFE
jgi:hypothetical protein